MADQIELEPFRSIEKIVDVVRGNFGIDTFRCGLKHLQQRFHINRFDKGDSEAESYESIGAFVVYAANCHISVLVVVIASIVDHIVLKSKDTISDISVNVMSAPQYLVMSSITCLRRMKFRMYRFSLLGLVQLDNKCCQLQTFIFVLK